jgi:hypothetical protein
MRKGQAAMEYLMTYGWAVLVIVIVIAALFSFTQIFKVGEQCLFSQRTFSCSDPSPQVLSDGEIIFTIKNLGQKAVIVREAGCFTEDSEIGELSDFTDQTIQAGGLATFSNVQCKRGASAVTPAAGSEFRGKLIVKYNYEDEPEGYQERQADATLSATVVQASGGGEPEGDEGGASD